VGTWVESLFDCAAAWPTRRIAINTFIIEGGGKFRNLDMHVFFP
jgi:hypothetical protein